MNGDAPKTLSGAVQYFADQRFCAKHLCFIRWPDGNIICPSCAATGARIGRISTRRLFRCKKCSKQFSFKINTIFANSPLGLDKWFVAIWASAKSEFAISYVALGRALGITQKSAWLMLYRIRMAAVIARRLHIRRQRVRSSAVAANPIGGKAFDSLLRQIVRIPNLMGTKVTDAVLKKLAGMKKNLKVELNQDDLEACGWNR